MKKKSLFKGKFLGISSLDGWEMCERVNCAGVVTVIAVTDDNKLILTEQFRRPTGKRTIELPAGLSGDDAPSQGEDLKDAAIRELNEETGYAARKMDYLFTGPSSAGLTNEEIAFFRATGLKKLGAGGGVAGEDITVHEVPLGMIHNWLARKMKDGFAVDPKVYAGLYFIGRSKRKTG